ncbi:GATA zinc finger domain-containing protein 14-like isoform X5 [Melanaphis sacchari]|uniref:RNA-binding protein 7 n=1 Tax=Melanaphis sacchari TaxID=742174 RepID=A0A2H8TNX9_9HEMI|nr:GATA zinc finger domain-containing protein 14-like isoform X5 [Melanaphis sacchari]
MDFADDTSNDEIDRSDRTLWVGNLHPKVSSRDIAELFFQVGPIEYVEFAFDENEICENFALVVFKHSSSVEDSLKFFKGTKLYGLPIITKDYSKHFEDPVFNDQLNYFKQLIKVEQNNGSTESNWIDQSLDEKNIPESLPEPPMHEERGLRKNQDNYDHRCSSKDNLSKYRHNARHTKHHNSMNSGEHYPIDKSHHNQKHYKKSAHNSNSGSTDMFNYEQDSYYHNPNNDHKHHDYTSFNQKDSAYFHEPMSMYHNKKSRYENLGHFESDSNNRCSVRNQNTHGDSNFSNKEPCKNNYNSERYNESNSKHLNHYTDRNYNQDKSHNDFHEYGSEFSNNYIDGYRRDKNRPINNKYNNHQNMESSNRQNNSYHPYKRNNEYSGQRHDRSYNRGGSDRSRHNYYS